MKKLLIPTMVLLAMLFVVNLGCEPDDSKYIAVYNIGETGGTAFSADGKVSIVFPSGALKQPTTVTIDSSPLSEEQSNSITDNFSVYLDPVPADGFEKMAVINFLQATENFRVARYTEIPGETVSEEHKAMSGWWIMPGTRLSVDGYPTAVVSGFSSYAAVSSNAGECEPGEGDIDPPDAPDGYTYAGTHVTVNSVFRPEYSTGISHSSDSAENLIFINSYTSVIDSVNECDIVIAHIYKPEDSPDESCEVPDDMLDPIDAPDGYRFAGYDVVINNVLVEEKSTIPLTYREHPDDINYMLSRTIVRDYGLVCDIIVRQLFIDRLEIGEMTDSRDGQIYRTIKIGTQTWMSENLNYVTDNSWCYDDDPENCEIYGRLYDWETALTACPPGSHLSSDEEWTTLTNYLGGEYVAGGKMKSTGTIEAGTGFWHEPNIAATNESGFSALGGGIRNHHGNFLHLGEQGLWWTSTDSDEDAPASDVAWERGLFYGAGGVSRNDSLKEDGFYVRCLRDDN